MSVEARTITSASGAVKADLHDLASIRLLQEPWHWRKAVLAADLPAGVKVAAFALFEQIHRKSGVCLMSMDRIGRTCGMTDRGVRSAMAQLRRAGLVTVRRRGFQRTNQIALGLPKSTGMAVPVELAADDGVTGMAVPGNRHGGAKMTGMAMPPVFTKNLSTEDLERPAGDSEVGKAVRSHQPSDTVVAFATTDSGRRARIGAVAASMIGSGPKLPDGRFADQVALQALSGPILDELLVRGRGGGLRRSDIALALTRAGIGGPADLAG